MLSSVGTRFVLALSVWLGVACCCAVGAEPLGNFQETLRTVRRQTPAPATQPLMSDAEPRAATTPNIQADEAIGLPPFVFQEQEAPPEWPSPNGWQQRFPFVDFSHRDPDDPGRHVGQGWPLEGTSWLNRPWHVDVFFGALNGDDLVERHVDQHTARFGGYRIGYDFDHYWGAEGRWGFSNPELGYPEPAIVRTAHDSFFDASLLYYPWGDAHWRPFLTMGLGWAEFSFRDDHAHSYKDTTVAMPIGCGVKYYFRNWMALRLDLMDNIAFSSERVDAMHNLSITIGAEMRIGRRKRSYFPWHTSLLPW